jgi:glycopeptide antibiotics resistance protein
MAYTLYMIYGTTLPFRFTLSRSVILEQLEKLISLQYYSSLPSSTIQIDGLSNILFFIPFGLFFFNAAAHRKDHDYSQKTFRNIIISGALLSTSVELLQIFTVNRSPSLLDILTNTVGTYLGVLIGYVMVQKGYREKLNLLFERISGNPDLFLISTYLLYLFLAALAPFNLNLSPFRIYWSLSRITEFEFMLHSNPSKIFGILYVFAPAGYIFARTLRRYNKGSYLFQTFTTIVIGFSLCFIVELIQLFVSSWYFSWPDIYMGWIGVLYGLFSYQLLHRKLYGRHMPDPWRSSEYGPPLYYFFLANYIVFLFYKFLYPFDFATEELARKLSFFLFDLNSYIPSKNMFDLVVILMKNVVLFVPAGVIIFENQQRSHGFWINLLMIFLILAAKSMQLINTHQRPLLYDFFGMGSGIAIGFLFWAEFKHYLFQTETGFSGSHFNNKFKEGP